MDTAQQINEIFEKNMINDLKDMINRHIILNTINIYSMYLSRLLQICSLFITTYGSSIESYNLIWIGVALNTASQLIDFYYLMNRNTLDTLLTQIKLIKTKYNKNEINKIDILKSSKNSKSNKKNKDNKDNKNYEIEDIEDIEEGVTDLERLEQITNCISVTNNIVDDENIHDIIE